MVSFIIVSIAILSGFMVRNLREDKHTNSINPSTDNLLNESMADGGTNSNLWQDNLEFFINETAVKKTKTTINEVTTFVLETRLFITNTGSKVATLDPDAFKITYDTEGSGLLFSTEYGDIEKPIVLEANQSTAINFVVKYVIQFKKSFIISKCFSTVFLNPPIHIKRFPFLEIIGVS
jgi:hypothetical protein